MNTERVISFFDKNTEELQGEVKLNSVPLECLKLIFKPPITDPLMYEPYTINPEHAKHLREYVDFDFTKYLYQVDCFQV